MSASFIVDAHVHTGFPGLFYAPEIDSRSLLKRMDLLGIQYAVNLGSMRTILESSYSEMQKAQTEYESSSGRLFFCGFFDPRRDREDLSVLRRSIRLNGFRGIKIHPSLSGIPADDPRYEEVWKFASNHDIPIVAHTWSVSSYNPVQVLSTPDKFEKYIQKYSGVRFIMGHSGGRGTGRLEAMRLAETYPNVYMDFAGDIYCLRYFETMAERGILDRVLFGSDYPWIDARSHLTRVYLADIPLAAKGAVFRDNALKVYRLE
jgi:predicted TIM-barrel fold metal-dependent hydrolase